MASGKDRIHSNETPRRQLTQPRIILHKTTIGVFLLRAALRVNTLGSIPPPQYVLSLISCPVHNGPPTRFLGPLIPQRNPWYLSLANSTIRLAGPSQSPPLFQRPYHRHQESFRD